MAGDVPAAAGSGERGDAEVAQAAARAANAVPGVAYLRPGFAELLRGGRGTLAPRGALGDRGAPGVKAHRQGDGSWRVRVHLAVRRGHRAVDVARAVRTAVEAAVRETARAGTGTDTGAAPAAAVSVTVTDTA
ncbi:Asp23/Gls24 family envelope stress response protein [Streptomyces sp. NPDC054796]